MLLVSNEFVWLFIFLLAFCGYAIRKGRKAFLAIFCKLALALSLSDVLAFRLLKPTFAQSRPCYVEEVRLVEESCGSTYGFPSNHSANAMAGAVIILSPFKSRKKYAIPVLSAVFLVGLSRIYLGVHYPSDVLCGFLLGFLCGLFVLKIAELWAEKRKSSAFL